jgi:hypothetical protein
VRQGCGGEPVDSLTSIRGHFGRRALTVIPACLLKMSPSKRRASRGGGWGSGVTSPSTLPSSSFLSSSPEDSGLGGGVFP